MMSGLLRLTMEIIKAKLKENERVIENRSAVLIFFSLGFTLPF